MKVKWTLVKKVKDNRKKKNACVLAKVSYQETNGRVYGVKIMTIYEDAVIGMIHDGGELYNSILSTSVNGEEYLRVDDKCFVVTGSRPANTLVELAEPYRVQNSDGTWDMKPERMCCIFNAVDCGEDRMYNWFIIETHSYYSHEVNLQTYNVFFENIASTYINTRKWCANNDERRKLYDWLKNTKSFALETHAAIDTDNLDKTLLGRAKRFGIVSEMGGLNDVKKLDAIRRLVALQRNTINISKEARDVFNTPINKGIDGDMLIRRIHEKCNVVQNEELVAKAIASIAIAGEASENSMNGNREDISLNLIVDIMGFGRKTNYEHPANTYEYVDCYEAFNKLVVVLSGKEYYTSDKIDNSTLNSMNVLAAMDARILIDLTTKRVIWTGSVDFCPSKFEGLTIADGTTEVDIWRISTSWKVKNNSVVRNDIVITERSGENENRAEVGGEKAEIVLRLLGIPVDNYCQEIISPALNENDISVIKTVNTHDNDAGTYDIHTKCVGKIKYTELINRLNDCCLNGTVEYFLNTLDVNDMQKWRYNRSADYKHPNNDFNCAFTAGCIAQSDICKIIEASVNNEAVSFENRIRMAAGKIEAYCNNDLRRIFDLALIDENREYYEDKNDIERYESTGARKFYVYRTLVAAAAMNLLTLISLKNTHKCVASKWTDDCCQIGVSNGENFRKILYTYVGNIGDYVDNPKYGMSVPTTPSGKAVKKYEALSKQSKVVSIKKQIPINRYLSDVMYQLYDCCIHTDGNGKYKVGYDGTAVQIKSIEEMLVFGSVNVLY